MEFRRRSSGYKQPGNSDTTARLSYLEAASATEPVKGTVILSRILCHNRHRILLAVMTASVGIAICVLVFTKGEELLHDFGKTFTIMIPLSAVGFLGTARKTRAIVLRMQAAMKVHQEMALQNPNLPFPGIAMSKYRLIFTIVTSILGILPNIPYLIIEGMELQVAIRRMEAESMPELDNTLLVLFALVIVLGVASLLTTSYGTYEVLLLLGKLCVPKRNRWYPLKIISSPESNKPVFLL